MTFDVVTARKALERLRGRVRRRRFVSDGIPWWCLECSLTPRCPRPMMSAGGKLQTVARVVLTAKLGRPLRHMALHRCDNPRCVDEDHLYEGDYLRNARDRVVRGRSNWPRSKADG